jgi:hypothetical protein
MSYGGAHADAFGAGVVVILAEHGVRILNLNSSLSASCAGYIIAAGLREPIK